MYGKLEDIYVCNSICFLNTFGFDRGILHDEALYPDPMTFKPERYLEKSESGANEYPGEAFGFGRRCV